MVFCLLFHRLFSNECGTYDQLQYYANNFDDFFVIMVFFISSSSPMGERAKLVSTNAGL